MSKLISREEIVQHSLTGEPLILVAVLPKRYFDQEHLPGAINIDHEQIEELVPDLIPDRETTIVAYCANAQCRNSGIAANRLERLGYTNVFKYEGGKQYWIEAGLPTESSEARSAA